jgi:uncharacterized membrane protein
MAISKRSSVSLLVIAFFYGCYMHTEAFTAPSIGVRFPGTRFVAAFKLKTIQGIALSALKSNEDKGEHKKAKTTQPTPVLVNAFQQLVGKDTPAAKAVPLAAAAMALVVMLSSPLQVDAAMSGGRMGGSFSSRSSGMSRVAPSSRGYRPGYGGGYGGGYYSRPSVTVAPIITPFYNPFFSPFSYGVGPGVISYGRGPGFFDLLLFGGIGFFILNTIRTASSAGSDALMSWTDSSSSVFGETTALGSGTSVVQLSVALDVPNRNDPNSILSVLDRLATTSKTDSRMGVQNLTSQVALEILRRKSSIAAGYSRVKHFNDRNKAQRDFNSLSVEERSKFEKEMVSRYGGVDYSQSSSKGVSSGSQATMAVITFVLSIDGDSTKVPTIRSLQDVETALRKIASDVKVDDCLTGAEILWTPEDKSETLTFRDVIVDYPELVSV